MKISWHCHIMTHAILLIIDFSSLTLWPRQNYGLAREWWLSLNFTLLSLAIAFCRWTTVEMHKVCWIVFYAVKTVSSMLDMSLRCSDTISLWKFIGVCWRSARADTFINWPWQQFVRMNLCSSYNFCGFTMSNRCQYKWWHTCDDQLYLFHLLKNFT